MHTNFQSRYKLTAFRRLVGGILMTQLFTFQPVLSIWLAIKIYRPKNYLRVKFVAKDHYVKLNNLIWIWTKNNYNLGREPWSCGYGRRLMCSRGVESQHRILDRHSSLIFFVKIVILKRRKWTKKMPGIPPIKNTIRTYRFRPKIGRRCVRNWVGYFIPKVRYTTAVKFNYLGMGKQH